MHTKSKTAHPNIRKPRPETPVLKELATGDTPQGVVAKAKGLRLRPRLLLLLLLLLLLATTATTTSATNPFATVCAILLLLLPLLLLILLLALPCNMRGLERSKTATITTL